MQHFTSSVVHVASSSSSSSSSSPTVTLYPPPNASSSNAALILRTPCLILRHPLPLSSSSLSAKPISRNTLVCTLRASPTQKHVYPDPSPQFAESVSVHLFCYEFCGTSKLVPFFFFFFILLCGGCCRRRRSSKLSS